MTGKANFIDYLYIFEHLFSNLSEYILKPRLSFYKDINACLLLVL